MGPDLINDIILLVADQAMAVADALAPTAQAIASSFAIVSIVMLGANIALGGGGLLAPLASMTMWSSIAYALATTWSSIIAGCLATANAALGLLAGMTGTLTLGEATAKITSRMMAEPASWGWSMSGMVTAIAQDVFIAFACTIVTIGLAIPMLLAMLAKLSLVLGAATAPLILGGLAFSVTRPLAFGALTFMVSSTLRIVTLGALSVMFARALQGQIDLPGADATLTFADNIGLVVTAVFAVLSGFSANSIAGQLVGSGVGALGIGSFARPVAAAAAASTGVGGALVGAGAAARAGGAAAGAAAGSAARSMGGGSSGGSISRSSGTGGNPFT